MIRNLPELLAPAGGFEAALAAFQYGADAIYVGLPRFSARADANNLTHEQLRLLVAYARSFTPAKKVYVTFNTLLQDSELPAAVESLAALDELGPDGVIVQDLGIARLIREHFKNLPLHASTQLAAHSLEGVLALKELGFVRVVTARELSFDEIRHLVQKSGVEIEIFVHGALCYSYSGLCLFSSHTTGRSGNRGRCAYCCREAFTDDANAKAYPFSMKDLALAPAMEALVKTGAHSLKIEGRMKSPLYVACVSDYYRHTLDGRLTPEQERAWISDLQTVFSRPWTSLYALDRAASPESIIDPVSIGHRGALIGTVEAVVQSPKDQARWLRFKTNRALEKHDGLQVDLPSGGKPFGCAVHALRLARTERTLIESPAHASVEVELPSDAPFIPPGSPVFCSASQAVRRRYEIHSLREADYPSLRKADFTVTLTPTGINVIARDAHSDLEITATCPLELTPSRQPERTPEAVRKAFERLGESAWSLGTLTLNDPQGLYAPPSKLNEARRLATQALTQAYEAFCSQRLSHLKAALTPAHPSSLAGLTAATWTLKVRISQLPEALPKVDTLVVDIEHASAETILRALEPLRRVAALRLATPLITREHEAAPLAATIAALVQAGLHDWECADLAGAHLLQRHAIQPHGADWTLYALNSLAAREVAEQLTKEAPYFVVSPEASQDAIRALSESASLTPEFIVYQQTPLFISETRPCIGEEEAEELHLSNRRDQTFTAYLRDGRWITVLDTPFTLDPHDLPEGYGRRMDLSWSPTLPHDLDARMEALRAGKHNEGHAANFVRGFN